MSFPAVGCYGVDRAVAEVKPRLSKKSNMEPLDAYEARLNNGHTFSKFFNWFREAEDLENEALRDNGTIKTDGQLDAVRGALEQVSPYYSHFRVSRSPRDFLMEKDGNQFSINQLSDGEKCYLTLVGDIARMLAMTNSGAANPLAGKGCILIDEHDKVRKTYLAVLHGAPKPSSGTLVTTIGRKPWDPKRMAVDAPDGKRAVTRWTVLEKRGGLALVEFAIETGRTHQIRVHAAHLGHPIVGDALYGSEEKDRRLKSRPSRQLLHAVQLEFPHPLTGEAVCIAAPPPADIIYAC